MLPIIDSMQSAIKGLSVKESKTSMWMTWILEKGTHPIHPGVQEDGKVTCKMLWLMNSNKAGD
jgi:hypothetical protein